MQSVCSASIVSGQIKGDGDPTCFSNAKDTGIPSLQQWCHQLTIASRESSARNFLAHIKTFATSVQSYVQGIGDVTVMDREDLRQKWQSEGFDDDSESESDDDQYGDLLRLHDHDPLYGVLGRGALLKKPKPPAKLDSQGNLVGIAPRLALVSAKL